MGYKRIGETMSFADIALSKSMENNRAIKTLERINKAIKWRNIEALLLEYYDVRPLHNRVKITLMNDSHNRNFSKLQKKQCQIVIKTKSY